jgi:hypothetical protein
MNILVVPHCSRAAALYGVLLISFRMEHQTFSSALVIKRYLTCMRYLPMLE